MNPGVQRGRVQPRGNPFSPHASDATQDDPTRSTRDSPGKAPVESSWERHEEKIS